VRQLCEFAFDAVGLDYRDYVTHDSRYDRPAEVDLLVGDYAKSKEKLGWEPTVHFKELVHMMVQADLARHVTAK